MPPLQATGVHVSGVVKPALRPTSPNFGSGPTKKRPGWTLAALADAPLGRSHRSKVGKDKLKRAIDMTRDVLQIPADYHIGIVPGSDTGAFEAAMWSLLGPRPVDVVSFESFGKVCAGQGGGWLGGNLAGRGQEVGPS
jgi:phosphoserine aminotransferase